MRRLVSLLLTVCVLLSLYACGKPDRQTAEPTQTDTPTIDLTADDRDKQQLNALYEGCTAYHGEAHDHADTGRRSDGKLNLFGWKSGMQALGMDFATIVDHRQTDHMYLEDWDDAIFIGGSEAMTYITDLGIEENKLHYNMIFADAESFEEVLREFPYEFVFSDGLFEYKPFTTAQFQNLIASIKKHGGMFVLVHPKSNGYINSEDPLKYWFADWTGLEVWYSYNNRDMNAEVNQKNYKLWTDLLAAGKYVWATAGHDQHKNPATTSLTTLYAEEQNAASFLSHMRVGDTTCGAIGIRMAIGDTKTGGQTDFTGKRLSICVGDFHRSVDRSHSYRMDLYDDTGVICSQSISSTEENWFATDTAETAKFYRVEIYDETAGVIVAIGNPIWNQ